MASTASTPTVTAVATAIAPAVREHGLVIDEVTITGPAQRSVVRISLDLPDDEIGGVSMEQIAQASRSVSDELDRADLFPRAYQLEVSSPGATRPLTELRHFKRARTRLVRLELVSGPPIVGRLLEVTEDELVLGDDEIGDERRIARNTVRSGQVEIELKRIDEADLGSTDEEG